MSEYRENLHECMTCGACCSHFRVSFYHGELEDIPQGFVPLHLTELLSETRACMRGTNQKSPRCIALSGQVGERVACTIYDKRPSACREFDIYDASGALNPDCRNARAEHGLAPLQLAESCRQ